MIGGGLTLVEVLMHLGWRADFRIDAGPGRARVYDNHDVVVGDFTAHETWALLRARGLVE